MMPMRRGGAAIGVLSVNRLAAGPLSDKQRDVLKTFANQAVIAIENTRLLNELRQRTDDLTESLEQQTATSDVLQVISGSPGDLDPVFDAMLANATRICQARFGVLYRYDGNAFQPAALANAPATYAEFVRSRGRFLPEAGNALDRLLRTRRIVRSADLLAEQVPTPSARLAGALADHRADAQGQRADRRDRHLPAGGAPVRGQAGCAGAELRRPSRHCHREHPTAQRAAAAHRRSGRITAAADRHCRNPDRHQQF